MSDTVQIRLETVDDQAAITRVIERAFSGHPYSDHTEQFVVAALRAHDALTISLVATRVGQVVGHVAFSSVTISDGTRDWYGLGPLAVEPATQRGGIGAELVRAGLARLRALGAAGCVVFGEATYYGRFGFKSAPALSYPGGSPEHFMALSFGDPLPKGEVAYHAAFESRA